MFRPFRFVLPVVLAAGALGFSGCIGTMYDDMYSYKKNRFKPPQEKHEADSYLSALDKPAGAATDAAVPGGLPPAGDIPGLPPAGAPDAGAPPAPAAPAPAAPAEPPK
jgi:hypothetical protein